MDEQDDLIGCIRVVGVAALLLESIFWLFLLFNTPALIFMRAADAPMSSADNALTVASVILLIAWPILAIKSCSGNFQNWKAIACAAFLPVAYIVVAILLDYFR